MSTPDKLHHLRIANSVGGRAEMTRMVYVLAVRPYVDVLHPLDQAREAVAGKNPYKQYPFVETASGQVVYQTMAIMHHAAHGTPAWPADPEKLTQALQVAMGGYDLYQWFGSFAADDLPAKKKFEENRAPHDIHAGDRSSFPQSVQSQNVAGARKSPGLKLAGKLGYNVEVGKPFSRPLGASASVLLIPKSRLHFYEIKSKALQELVERTLKNRRLLDPSRRSAAQPLESICVEGSRRALTCRRSTGRLRLFA
jgi:hypothetical protein